MCNFTPRRAYSPAAILAHRAYRTHCHLCPSRYSFSPESSEAFEGEVRCTRTQHRNNVPRLRGEKLLHQTGLETARQAATSAKRHVLTIVPCPSDKEYSGRTVAKFPKHRPNTNRKIPNYRLHDCLFARRRKKSNVNLLYFISLSMLLFDIYVAATVYFINIKECEPKRGAT